MNNIAVAQDLPLAKSAELMPQSGKGVFDALHKVHTKLALMGISKTSEVSGNNNSKFQKYKFRGIDEIYNIVSPILAEFGLLCLPNVLQRHSERMVAADGVVSYKCSVMVEYTFISTSDGSQFKTTMVGESIDKSDKGVSKALSMAHKYLFLQTFAIPTDTDHDPDKYVHEQQIVHVPQHQVSHQNNRQNAQQNPNALADKEMVNQLHHAFVAAGGNKAGWVNMLKNYGITHTNQLTLAMVKNEMQCIQDYINQQQQIRR